MTTLCKKHLSTMCYHYCKPCNIPICELCASSKRHRGHAIVDVEKELERQKHDLEGYLQELEKIIYPKYKEVAAKIPVQRADLKENSKTLTEAIKKHGEDLHREIDTTIKELIAAADLDEMDSKGMAVLNSQEDEINSSISEIKQLIADLNKLLGSSDISLLSAYECRNADFRKVPPKLIVTLPIFIRQKIKKELIYQQFGFLSSLSIKTEEHGNTEIESISTESSPPDRPFIDKPRTITDINTEYGDHPKGLCSVSCLSNEKLWTSSFNNSTMRLYNIKGELVKSIMTKSRNNPCDIAVTISGDLVYTDDGNRTVNMVRNTQIYTLIIMQGWEPRNICITSSGDLLVVMISDIDKQTKLVRYSGSTEKQTIQYDDKGQSLYSASEYIKLIAENRNLDICVADAYANAIVVVNEDGKLRFTYNGHSCTFMKRFSPHGITTDSHSRTLTVNSYSSCIDILDQDGQFLRYIDNCDLHIPMSLCVDTRDNLFVAQRAGKVKKIQYYM